MSKKRSSYPRFLVSIGGSGEYLPLGQAARALNNGLARVVIHDTVLEEDGKIRPITARERQRINEVADRQSEDK